MTGAATSRPADRPADGLPGLLDELRWRGLFHDATPGLAGRLATGRRLAAYNGFDPSGPSLHVGHLVPVMGLVHLQRRGGRPVLLVGGATGMIGDPSGTSAERNLLDRPTLDANVAAIRSQLERFLDFSGASGALMVNNLDWLGGVSMLDFLRDVGKHFTVPYMLGKDSIRDRLGAGLSYTEFSYMLLQAADFRHLYRTLEVEAQMGGADQWGNITAGLELIRRSEGAAEGQELAHALAFTLLLDPGGTKFGKTAAGTSVWLDPARTSPYAFYQYWLDREDAEVGRLLRFFTLLDRAEIEALEAEQAARPEARPAQRALARDLTTRVHGDEATAAAIRVSEAVFSAEPVRDPAVLATLYEAVDGFTFRDADLRGGALAFAVASGTFASNGEARRTIAQGGLSINDERIARPDSPVPAPIAGEWLVVRVGKKRLRVGRRAG
ncbi:MAG: tyrosine--tRNA ligase [Chloroflexota bacterium]|nr:tyrosine--tRNA ligase [Chloroflexota bacterium]